MIIVSLPLFQFTITSESFNVLLAYHLKDAGNVIMLFCIALTTTLIFVGDFVPYYNVPSYWVWLRQLDFYAQAWLATTINLFESVDFHCQLNSEGSCMGVLEEQFNCILPLNSNSTDCYVHGRNVLEVVQGLTESDTKWKFLIALLCLYILFRLLILIEMCFPVRRYLFKLVDYLFLGLFRYVIDEKIKQIQLERTVDNLIYLSKSFKERKYSRGLDGYDEEEGKFVPVDLNVVPARRSSFSTLSNGSTVPSLTWRRLTVTGFHSGKKVVDCVSGIAKSARSLALMGPVSSGAPTLLKALCNRTANSLVVEGDIRFCGRSLSIDDVAYIPRANNLNSSLTIVEQIEFIGCLRCKDTESVRHRLHSLLLLLGLYHKMNVLCGSLSDGDRKIVDVCTGMIVSPNVLLLDEPTFGLDSTSAYSVISLLSKLVTDTGVVLIMTVHQPSSFVFKMLQDLCIMESGRLVYFGTCSDAMKFFSALGFQCPEYLNPADYYLDLVSSSPTEDPSITWKDLFLSFNFRALMTARDGVENIDTEPLVPPSLGIRYKLLYHSFKRGYDRDWGFYWHRYIFAAVIAFILGTNFSSLNNNNINNIKSYAAIAFHSILTLSMGNIFVATNLARDKKLAMDQARNGLFHPSSYCFAQFIASWPYCLMLSFVHQSIIFLFSNLSSVFSVYLYCVFMLFLTVLVSDAVILIIVQVIGHALLSVIGAVVIIGTFLLFTGYLGKVSTMPIWIAWIAYLMPTKVL